MSTMARIVSIAGLFAAFVCVALLHFLRTDLPPVSHRLSEYANGPYGWVMTAAFVFLGCALVALGIALRAETPHDGSASWTIPAAAFAAGAGSLVSAVFRTGVSDASEAVHSRASGLATVALVALALAYSLAGARRTGATLTPGISLAFTATALAALSPLLHETRWTGLSQRLLWVTLSAWLVWAAVRRIRPRDEAPIA